MTTSPQIVQIQGGTFEELGHVYRDPRGQEVPSVTQILDSCGLVDFSNVPGDTLERKRQIGDAVHFATRLDDQDDLDPFSVGEETAPYLIAYQRFRDDVGFVPEPEWIEKGFIHSVHGMTYAGTVDRIGKFANSRIKHRVLLELKCAFTEEAAWKIQMAGYELAVPKAQGEHIARVVVQLKKDGSFKLYLYENPRDSDIFKICLSLVCWRRNEGLPWKRS